MQVQFSADLVHFDIVYQEESPFKKPGFEAFNGFGIEFPTPLLLVEALGIVKLSSSRTTPVSHIFPYLYDKGSPARRWEHQLTYTFVITNRKQGRLIQGISLAFDGTLNSWYVVIVGWRLFFLEVQRFKREQAMRPTRAAATGVIDVRRGEAE